MELQERYVQGKAHLPKAASVNRFDHLMRKWVLNQPLNEDDVAWLLSVAWTALKDPNA